MVLDDVGALAGGVGLFEGVEGVVAPGDFEAADGGGEEEGEGGEEDYCGVIDDDFCDCGPEAAVGFVMMVVGGPKGAGADDGEEGGG